MKLSGFGDSGSEIFTIIHPITAWLTSLPIVKEFILTILLNFALELHIFKLLLSIIDEPSVVY